MNTQQSQEVIKQQQQDLLAKFSKPLPTAEKSKHTGKLALLNIKLNLIGGAQ